MEDITEAIYITEHKDSDYFKKLKTECWEAASNDKEIDFSKLPPPEYKYFSELYWLYNDLSHKKISKEEAAERDRVNYKEFVEYADKQLDYIHGRIIINDNIHKAGTLLSEIEKATTAETVALKACEAIGCMIDDEGFLKRYLNRVGEQK